MRKLSVKLSEMLKKDKSPFDFTHTRWRIKADKI